MDIAPHTNDILCKDVMLRWWDFLLLTINTTSLSNLIEFLGAIKVEDIARIQNNAEVQNLLAVNAAQSQAPTGTVV